MKSRRIVDFLLLQYKVDYNLTSDEILGHIKAYEIVMDECEQKLQQAGI